MKWLIGILVVFAAVYAGYHYRYPSTQLNFRTTVEVETPEGVRTGTGVIEGVYAWVPSIVGRGFVTGLRGEAVVVDLGSRGLLFALLKTDLQHDSPLQYEYLKIIAYDVIQGTRTRETIWKIGKLSGHAVLDVRNMPLLVRFREINDPTTVELVDPRDLAASFGAGIKLKQVVVETTNKPVTTGIERSLGWLPDYYDRHLDGSQVVFQVPPPTLAHSLGAGSFKAIRN